VLVFLCHGGVPRRVTVFLVLTLWRGGTSRLESYLLLGTSVSLPTSVSFIRGHFLFLTGDTGKVRKNISVDLRANRHGLLEEKREYFQNARRVISEKCKMEIPLHFLCTEHKLYDCLSTLLYFNIKLYMISSINYFQMFYFYTDNIKDSIFKYFYYFY